MLSSEDESFPTTQKTEAVVQQKISLDNASNDAKLVKEAMRKTVQDSVSIPTCPLRVRNEEKMIPNAQDLLEMLTAKPKPPTTMEKAINFIWLLVFCLMLLGIPTIIFLAGFCLARYLPL